MENIICFTPGDNCVDEILNLLDSAKSTIDICVFTISDDRISKKIVNCMEKGINVKIITDNDKQHDKGSDVNWLFDKGVKVKMDMSKNHMHHKFAIIDNKKILTGSYNWTRSAAKYNHENFLITDNKKTVREFKTEFDKLWESMTWLE